MVLQAEVDGIGRERGLELRATLIAMVEPAHLWDGDDLAFLRRHASAPVRGVAAKRQVQTRVVVVVDVGRHDAPEVLFTKHNEVVQAFTPD